MAGVAETSFRGSSQLGSRAPRAELIVGGRLLSGHVDQAPSAAQVVDDSQLLA
jgi:hypothetical protein